MKTTSALYTTGTGCTFGELGTVRTTKAFAPKIVPLAEGALVTWSCKSPQTFHVRRGSVWITSEHSTEDFIIEEGESLRLEKAGKVIAQSLLGSATLEVHE